MYKKSIILITCLLFLYPNSKAVSKTVTDKNKTIKRSVDYIVIRGNKLKNNLNKKISGFSLLSLKNNQVKPIPFQIDELNPEEDYILIMIPPHLKDNDLKPEIDADKGCLDNNDELSFMARDSGDRLSKSSYPAGASAVDEIKLTDPIGKGSGWVYLCYFENNAPASDKDYVKYAFPADNVLTEAYRIGFSKELPIAPDLVSVYGSQDMFDRLKLRLDMKIFFVPYSIYENDFVSKLSLYNDGPIRVIRRTKTAIKVMGVFQTPSAAVENLYYDKILIIPFRIKVPINLPDFKSVFKAKMRAGVDFCNLHGWKIKTNAGKTWYNIDGKTDDQEQKLNGLPLKWFVFSGVTSGKKTGLLINMVFDKRPDGTKQESPFMPTLYYVDDDNKPDPPEFVKGQSPNICYWMNGFENIKKETLYFYAVIYIIDNYSDGMEQTYLQIMDNPVEVNVNE